jgi:3-oxoacyl-[acyl-carrier protein] reductase
MVDVNLQGKVVAVTGAAGRLGQHLMQRFGEQGATLAAIVRSEDEARRCSFEGRRGQAFVFDATRDASVRAGFGQIQAQYGHLDALLHTVGGWGSKPLLETTQEDWEQLVRVNLTSAFLCFREAVRLMQGRAGRLVGIASGQGADRGAARQGAYSAAKAGVIRLVEAVAAEFEDEQIKAFAIAPSTILYDEAGSGVHAAYLAELCLYLCSAAGEALNGATLRAYGSKRPG